MHYNRERVLQARLKANMSRADLAYAIRRLSDGHVKATERGLRGWEKGEYEPSGTAVAAIAKATGHDIEFFYGGSEPAGDDDELEAALHPEIVEALSPLARLLDKASAASRQELAR